MMGQFELTCLKWFFIYQPDNYEDIMISRYLYIAILLLVLAAPVCAESDDVRINGKVMTSEEMNMWRIILQVPQEYYIFPGDYWYFHQRPGDSSR